jgi:hypothetical protein
MKNLDIARRAKNYAQQWRAIQGLADAKQEVIPESNFADYIYSILEIERKLAEIEFYQNQ